MSIFLYLIQVFISRITSLSETSEEKTVN